MRSVLLFTTIIAATALTTHARAQSHCAAPATQPFLPTAATSAGDVPSEPRIGLAPPVTAGEQAPRLRLRLRPPSPDSTLDSTGPAATRDTASVIGAASTTAQPTVDMETVPALVHYRRAGATLSDMGIAHGLRTLFAKNGGQFMILELTPDHQATVAGLVTEISIAQLQALAPGALVPLPVAHGLKGYFLRNGKSFQVLYATPDNKAVVPGIMWDASGADLTREQVASIPGAVPTVVLGKQDQPAASGPSAVSAPSPGGSVAPVSFMRAAASATYGTVGNSSSIDLWMFIDPQCVFSMRAMAGLQPAVTAGRIKLHVIPLSFLDGEDGGLSTKRALQLVSAPANDMISDWESGRTLAVEDAGGAAGKLQANMQAAAELRLTGTPTFFWRRTDGRLGRFDGLPPDLDGFLERLGS